MGAIATINDNRILTGATRLLLPTTLGTNIEFVHICTSGLAFALQNFAADSSGNAKGNATQSGVPVVGSGFLSLQSGTNFLTTAMVEPIAGTLLTVCQRTGTDDGTQASRPNFIGTFSGGGGNTGVSMYPNTAGQLAATMLTNNGAGNQSPAALLTDTMGNWGCRMMVFDNTGVSVIDQTTGGKATTAPTSGYTRVASAKKVLIGSAVGTSFAGFSNVMLAMGWSRVLTDSEKIDAYTFAKKFAAIVGITI